MSFEDRGVGRAAVLLHGWPVTTYHWRYLSPELLKAGRRVLAVTLPGLGDQGAAPGPFDKLTLARHVRDLLTEQRIPTATIIGHDWGSTVGYLLAADAPDLVDMLVVEEEIPPGVDVEIPEPGRSHYPTWHGPFLRARGLAEGLIPGREHVLHRAFLDHSAGPSKLGPDAVEQYLTAYAHPAQLAATLGYYRSTNEDTAAVQRCASRPLQMPVVTIGGAYAMGWAVHHAFARRTERVKHVQAERAGHYPLEQSLEAVTQLMQQLTASA